MPIASLQYFGKLFMLKKIWHYWKKFAFKVGEINFKVIMTIFYFIILGLFAIPFRLTHDILLIKKKYATFWKDRDVHADLNSAKKQY